MYDMQGNHVFTIKKEHLHIHTTFVGEDPAGNKLFEVKSKFSSEFYSVSLLDPMLMVDALLSWLIQSNHYLHILKRQS